MLAERRLGSGPWIRDSFLSGKEHRNKHGPVAEVTERVELGTLLSCTAKGAGLPSPSQSLLSRNRQHLEARTFLLHPELPGHTLMNSQAKQRGQSSPWSKPKNKSH